MKKLLLLFVSLILVISYSYAGENDQTYKRLIAELDIDTAAIRASSVDDFWTFVWKKNGRLYEFYKAFDKKKSSAVKANNDIGKSLYFSADYFNSLEIEADNSDNRLIGLLEDLGALKVFPDIQLYIVNNSEANAFSTPDGRIYLNTGLFVDGMTYPHILGICAHEFAHFLLQHAKVHCYKYYKKEQGNKIAAAIMSATNVLANGYAAASGVKTDWGDVNTTTIQLFEAAELSSNRFRYKYSREQEIEADIIACRLLKYLGYGGEKYIEALSLVKKTFEYLFIDDDSTHPSTSFRTGLLKYMLSHPEIKRKEPKEVFE